MDTERLERLEVGERIAFERGRQAALSGVTERYGLINDLIDDLVDEIRGTDQNLWDVHTPLANAASRGLAYGDQILEEERVG